MKLTPTTKAAAIAGNKSSGDADEQMKRHEVDPRVADEGSRGGMASHKIWMGAEGTERHICHKGKATQPRQRHVRSGLPCEADPWRGTDRQPDQAKAAVARRISTQTAPKRA